MSIGDPNGIEFDARMRRLFADLDTAPGFEARVMQRVATQSRAPRRDLRAQIERARSRSTRDLARQAWTNAATAAGVGAAGIAIVWRHRLEITQAVQAGLAGAADSGLLVGIAAVVLVAGLWPALRKYVTPL
jgi:hypothetical protein